MRKAASTAFLLASLALAAAPAAQQGSEGVELARQARTLVAQGDDRAGLLLAQAALAAMRRELGGGHEYVAYVLDDLAGIHFRLGELDAAEASARQAVATLGARRDRPHALLVGNLASILAAKGRFFEAEPLFRTALEITSGIAGSNSPDYARLAGNLGLVQLERSHVVEGRGLLEEAAGAYRRHGGEHKSVLARTLLSLAGVQLRQEQVEQALQSRAEAASILAGLNPPEPGLELDAEVMAARILVQQSRLREAETRLRALLSERRAAAPPQSLEEARILYTLAFIHVLTGEAIEAEALLKRVVAAYVSHGYDRHPAMGRAFHSLALAYQQLGELREADEFYARALEVFSACFGEADASLASTLGERALLRIRQKNAEGALRDARTALAMFDALPEEFALRRALATSGLAFALRAAGRASEARETFEAALSALAAIRGGLSPDLVPGLNELAKIAIEQGDLNRAEDALAKASTIGRAGGASTPAVLGETLRLLAELRVLQQRPKEALSLADRYIAIARGAAMEQEVRPSALTERQGARTRNLVDSYLQVAMSARGQADDGPAHEARMFEVAQRAQLTETGAAIARMAARFTPSDPVMAGVIRKRQDLLIELRALDRRLTDALASGELSRGSHMLLMQEREAKSLRLQELDALLLKRFPDYAELVDPRSVPLDDARKLLKPGEAILLQVTAERRTFLFLLAETGLRIAESDLGRDDLRFMAIDLREQLEPHASRFIGDHLPFDAGIAHELYRKLLKPFESELSSVRHLIVIPDGAMQNLPFHVLLTQPATGEESTDPANLPFLLRRHAITTVPSLSALRALRGRARYSTAASAFIGFGDPLLRGDAGGPAKLSADAIFKLGRVDIDAIRRLPPLAETRAELVSVSAALGGREDHLYFGPAATEAKVKSVDLSRFRAVAFATHGLVAGEFLGLSEPALVLTPPAAPSGDDDGLLTASEIAGLELDADVVLLSACNTASPDGRPGAEGLSGLAKAFFHAGARSLVVSHWQVASSAAVTLTSSMAEQIRADPSIGRAEALRRAMLSLARGDKGRRYANPGMWAPFVVVGEGG